MIVASPSIVNSNNRQFISQNLFNPFVHYCKYSVIMPDCQTDSTSCSSQYRDFLIKNRKSQRRNCLPICSIDTLHSRKETAPLPLFVLDEGIPGWKGTEAVCQKWHKLVKNRTITAKIRSKKGRNSVEIS